MTGSAWREKHRAATRDEILRIASDQVAGGNDITLRGISREIHMTAPGLYRYFANSAHLCRTIAETAMEQTLPGIAEYGWPGYMLWATSSPGWFALLAKPEHADLMARLHAAANTKAAS